jgi:hypothetical protein
MSALQKYVLIFFMLNLLFYGVAHAENREVELVCGNHTVKLSCEINKLKNFGKNQKGCVNHQLSFTSQSGQTVYAKLTKDDILFDRVPTGIGCDTYSKAGDIVIVQFSTKDVCPANDFCALEHFLPNGSRMTYQWRGKERRNVKIDYGKLTKKNFPLKSVGRDK